ncbi:hypothetical protein F5X97DRAFT_283455 [Nemania serpens]|nr:hypothetical protein F5X97DRAFT_283455 [Nemania serpens]
MSVALASASAAKATPTLSRHLGSSSSCCFSRSIATEIYRSATIQPLNVPASQKRPPNVSTSQKQPSTKVRKPERGGRQVQPFFALNSAPYSLATTYTENHKLGFPMLIRDLPGFLDGQAWIDHKPDHEASFKVPQKPQIKDPVTGFDLLKNIFESAATGRNPRDMTSTESANSKAVFDDIEGECRIARASFEGDDPPILKFRNWLRKSDFRDHLLDKTIVELQEASRVNTLRTEPLQWISFRAPLAFIRAVHQYNRDQKIIAKTVPSSKDGSARDKNNPACITRINGLVVLTDAMTEEFPFPRILRDMGPPSYRTKSCNIRMGVRPPRGDMRRCRNTTVVIGQLAGSSAVTLVRARLKLLNGQSLECHERVRPTWENSARRFPLGPASFAIKNSIWTRSFQNKLIKSGDLFVGTLVPGSAVFVPKGWYYGVRSTNKELELNATVTWFRHRGDIAVEDQEEDEISHLKKFPPWVKI